MSTRVSPIYLLCARSTNPGQPGLAELRQPRIPIVGSARVSLHHPHPNRQFTGFGTDLSIFNCNISFVVSININSNLSIYNKNMNSHEQWTLPERTRVGSCVHIFFFIIKVFIKILKVKVWVYIISLRVLQLELTITIIYTNHITIQ